jgi:hypothetical protein
VYTELACRTGPPWYVTGEFAAARGARAVELVENSATAGTDCDAAPTATSPVTVVYALPIAPTMIANAAHATAREGTARCRRGVSIRVTVRPPLSAHSSLPGQQTRDYLGPEEFPPFLWCFLFGRLNDYVAEGEIEGRFSRV